MNNTATIIMEKQNKQKTRRKLQGVVTSDKMSKTRIVNVHRTKMHSRYRKRITVSKRYMAHDERGEYHIGDTVVFEETRPLSRHKRWRIIGRVETKQISKSL